MKSNSKSFMKSRLLILFSVVALLSCKKDVSELPPSTQTGANTFGAKIDGAFWVPQGFGIVPTASVLEARFSGTDGVFINARNFSSSPTETEFEIYLKDITGPGTYLLNQTTQKEPNHSASYAYYVKRKITPLNEYITGASYTGKVELTKFDIANHIISGTFEFIAGDIDTPSLSITVTEGRFDIKLQ